MSKSGIALLVLCLGVSAAAGAEEEEDDDVEDLRERLTEREDKRRPERSWSTLIGDRPLVISGEYEFEPRFVRRFELEPDDDPLQPIRQRDRLRLETGIEVEAFYSFGSSLSLFGQARLTSERDLLNDVRGEISDLYVEPGEVWLFSEGVAGTDLDLEIGRLHFEDERRWWWDDELEAARVGYEAGEVELSLAVARRLLSERSDRSYIDPEDDRVLRWIAHASWDFRASHGIELFAVHHDDRSSTERLGEIVKSEREDDSDARLRWLGARAMGVFDLRPRATLGYWLDAAWLRGDERRIGFDDVTPTRSEVLDVDRRSVRGFGYDAGTSLSLASIAGEPRIFASHARATRDFRQTGLEANEPGFGGVERFRGYGILLDPELTDLGVDTLGAGLSLLRSSSLDLVYHRYRLRSRRSVFLPGIELEADLEPAHSDLGQELDLLLAIEEWERLELELGVAVFRAGRAFDRAARGETSFGAFAAIRVAF